jgi:pSer/pThr/pTyr-binding forkhead associated (FHA) protein
MEVKLKIVGGPKDGTLIDVLSSQFLIGRSDECQLRPKSEAVSRRHAALLRNDSKAVVQDLGSRTGTYVNGKLIPPKSNVDLKNGDQLRIGPLEFAVVISFGLGGQKKPKVASLEEAAARTAQGPAEEVDVTQWLQADADADMSLGETMDSNTGTVISAADLMGPAKTETPPDAKAKQAGGAEAPDQAASDMLKNYLRRR